ncbi:iron-containing alcohol dehydrogenase family protein [Halorubellus sp. PRR65]|uniref:iron-containing alcohol dehydrogenase family protein n=1 Tax=Halorubellus sp. PRR65 TaxID=3098148 RepID=UPI002B25B351|nr:iron-containing alcohol dehydrogenase family protein [Halorubellus sp. PRR65]
MVDGDTDRNGESFRFEYDPGILRYGRGCVNALEDELAEHGIERALVVCGETVGSTPAVVDPVTDGLGDRFAGVFAGTTPQKRLATAFDALDAMREHDADALVALGGGSSLDVAKVAAVLAATDRDAVGERFQGRGTITIPDTDLPPVVAVPTTLAGADLSIVAGITAHPENGLVDDPASGGVGDPRLMPAAIAYDPELFATTPKRILAGSAMNGFNKGLETLYSRHATPVTDATAARGLGLLADGLVELGRGDVDADTLAPVVEGIVLVQYGISRPDAGTLSVIHAFGHGLTHASDVQQGEAHAVVTPHVLEYLFEHVDGRRDRLADALGVDDDDTDPAGGIVDAVTDVVDALDLPTRLRDIDGPGPGAFEAIARYTLDDPFMANAPTGLDPTRDELERVLEAAY